MWRKVRRKNQLKRNLGSENSVVGGNIKIVGKRLVSLKLPSKHNYLLDYKINVLVIKGLVPKFIIGLDFMKANNADIDVV